MRHHPAFFLLLCVTVQQATAARILAYFPVPAPSHHFFFQPFLYELGQRGHQVDYYSPIPMRVPHENVTLFQLENFMLSAIEKFAFYDQWKFDVLTQMALVWNAGLYIDQEVCPTKPIQDLLSSNAKYDLLIHEGLFWFESSVIFHHKFNIPSVALLSVADFFYSNDVAGFVSNPSFMVQAWTESTDRMGFLERLRNMIAHQQTLWMYYSHLRGVQNHVDHCFTYPGSETRPPLTRLLSDQSLILVNSHPSVIFSFPAPPHLKEIGGGVLQSKKPLPQNVYEFVDGATEGVIYFSLGSLFDMESAMPHLKVVFSRVFSSRKERVLWKWIGKRWKGLSDNVMLSEWFPQQDILAHSNVKLFITHGGLQSAFETVNFGIPVIAIPIFTDQDRNSMALAQHGYGVLLRLHNITEESLNWALNETLYQPKYKDQVVKGSAALRDRPLNPVDEGVYWIEFVLRQGDVLQPQGTRLSFIQLHCWDLYAFLLAALAITIYLVKKIFSWLLGIHERTLPPGYKILTYSSLPPPMMTQLNQTQKILKRRQKKRRFFQGRVEKEC